MKKLRIKNAGGLAFGVAVLICVFFLVHVLSLGSEYSSGVNNQAAERASFYAEDQARYIEAQCDAVKEQAIFFATKLQECDTQASVTERLTDLHATARKADQMFLAAFCFTVDGKTIGWTGRDELKNYPVLTALETVEGTKISGIFQYNNEVMSIAGTAEVTDSYATRVVVIYDRTVLSISDYAYEEGSMQDLIRSVKLSEFVLLCKHDGIAFDRIVNNTEDFTIGYDETVSKGLFRNLLSSDEEIENATVALQGTGTQTFLFMQNTENYILTVTAFGEERANLSLVCVYKVSNVYGDGYTLMTSIWSSLLGLAVIMAILAGSMIADRLSSRKKMLRMEMIDSTVNCPTPKKFEHTCEDLIKKNAGAGYAFVSIKINNFGYVSEKLGDNAAIDLARYCADTVHHALLLEETFAYAGSGEFLLLIHYRERQAFTDRLNSFYLRLCAYNGIGDGFKTNVSFSVYEVEREQKQTVKDMLKKLTFVKSTTAVRAGSFNIQFYEDVLHENYFKRAEIEGKMEHALQNSEFHLFYQPKYNLRSKTIDGSEILIRWYDPDIGGYHVPDEFIPVFEENGFISKVDRFVFYKACENIATRRAERKTCYPVSVNVSRVTAIQSDFLDYYIRIKKKFDIQDNFLTVEFTESFAYENYEYLKEVVQTLHDNGILCSIDDFGTGYSSYNILKDIPMDEIKMDKFFLRKGLSAERDQVLLDGIIGMVKKLGMKVTQEGVETREDLYRLEALGCDVIQGYYFAKPMKYVDYCEFVETNFGR